MADRFDVIIVGSGFGGSVAACRLAEQGQRVLVLERGRRWEPKDYPSSTGKDWVYDNEEAAELNGWFEVRLFPKMYVVAGAGVGGGSLVYANVSLEAPAFVFEHGWPPEITLAELKPYYDRVGRMLDLQEVPIHQQTPRFKLVREGAEALGYGDHFSAAPLAINFDPDLKVDFANPPTEKDTIYRENRFGKVQGTCVFLANCDVGCNVQAKNTLDLNYLAVAERHGAEIRPLHLVRWLEPAGGGWRVHFDRIEEGRCIAGSECAPRLILAAGSLGSSELLLRSRDQYRSLPRLSDFLGRDWSANGDFLTPAFYADRKLYPSVGPTISATLDLLDGEADPQGERFTVEDGGLPDLLEDWVRERLRKPPKDRFVRKLLCDLAEHLAHEPPFERLMPWFANGIDASNGRFFLGRRIFWPWQRKLCLDWPWRDSAPLFNAILAMHKRLSDATGGHAVDPIGWTVFHTLITPHPLGGCSLGVTPDHGVVDHRGRVFGYENLFVLDGSIIPAAIGRNPSRTIAALAERAVELMKEGD